MKISFFLIVFFIIGCVSIFFYLFGNILIPFILSFIVAYLLNPICVACEKCNISRSCSASIVTCLFFILVSITGWFTIPYLILYLNALLLEMPNYLHHLGKLFFIIQKTFHIYYGMDISAIHLDDNSINQSLNTGMRWILDAIAFTRDSIKNIFSVLMVLILTPFLTFYVLRDFSCFLDQMLMLVPVIYKDFAVRTVKSMDTVFVAFVRGQLTVCIIMGFYYTCSLYLLNLNFAIIVGFGLGFLIFIPYLGIFAGAIVTFAIAYSQFNHLWPFLGLSGVFTIGQIVEAYVITPYFLGGRIGLHPVVMIFSVLAGGELLGVFGVLISIPVAAILGVLIRLLFCFYLESSFYKHEV